MHSSWRIKNAFVTLAADPDVMRSDISQMIERQVHEMMRQVGDQMTKMLQGAAIRVDNRIDKMSRDAVKQMLRAKNPAESLSSSIFDSQDLSRRLTGAVFQRTAV